MRIAVLGAGSWGSALAIACSKVANVTLWAHRLEQVTSLQLKRNNPHYLPEHIQFAENVNFTGQLNDCVSADLIIIATPLNALRKTIQELKAVSWSLPDLILVSKGFEAATAKLPHEIIADELPGFKRSGVLLGPSFASEVAEGLPTAITLAAFELDFALKWMQRLKDIPNFRIYAHDDVVGSEVGAAVKNVLAIAVGIADGLNLGYNARAALITRSLNELASLVLSLGGRRETIYGLTGIGDLILTCTGDLSRNRQVGQLLAAGQTIAQITQSLGHVAEGISTSREIYLKSQQLALDMPIVASVYRIIYQQADIYSEVNRLINRQPKAEFNK